MLSAGNQHEGELNFLTKLSLKIHGAVIPLHLSILHGVHREFTLEEQEF